MVLFSVSLVRGLGIAAAVEINLVNKTFLKKIGFKTKFELKILLQQ